MTDHKVNAVRVEHIDGEWAVQVMEKGEVTQHRFELRSFAVSFATGQRMRLGVPAQDDVGAGEDV